MLAIYKGFRFSGKGVSLPAAKQIGIYWYRPPQQLRWLEEWHVLGKTFFSWTSNIFWPETNRIPMAHNFLSLCFGRSRVGYLRRALSAWYLGAPALRCASRRSRICAKGSFTSVERLPRRSDRRHQMGDVTDGRRSKRRPSPLVTPSSAWTAAVVTSGHSRLSPVSVCPAWFVQCPQLSGVCRPMSGACLFVLGGAKGMFSEHHQDLRGLEHPFMFVGASG